MDSVPGFAWVILAAGILYLLLGVRDWLSATGSAREELAKAAKFDARARLIEAEHKFGTAEED